MQRLRDKTGAIAVVEAMAEVAEVPTQSALANEKVTDGDDDLTPAGLVAEIIAVGRFQGTKDVRRYFVFAQRSRIGQYMGSLPCAHHHTRRRRASAVVVEYIEEAKMGWVEAGSP